MTVIVNIQVIDYNIRLLNVLIFLIFTRFIVLYIIIFTAHLSKDIGGKMRVVERSLEIWNNFVEYFMGGGGLQ